MPRKDFVNHLKEAKSGRLPQYLSCLESGEDDGAFTVIFEVPGQPQFQIHASVSDVGDYPKEHMFYIYTNNNDIPKSISKAIEKLSMLHEMTVMKALQEISNKLCDATAPVSVDSDTEMEEADDRGDGDVALVDEEDFADADDLDDTEDPFDNDENDYDDIFGSPKRIRLTSPQASSTSQYMNDSERKEFAQTVCSDIKHVKNAGFRVSHSGPIMQPGSTSFLMVSVRVAKLGIPEDALEAWNLRPSEYIMLLIKYAAGYRSFHMLKDSTRSKNVVSLHVLVTKRHKLSTHEIYTTINADEKVANEIETTSSLDGSDQPARSLFIGSALDEMMNTRLITLIQFRLGFGLNWAGAMEYYNERSTYNAHDIDTSKYFHMNDDSKIESLPSLVTADHIGGFTVYAGQPVSLPLTAMQFTLRHIVRCTEFCLVCFDKTKDEFEALKPYVCSKPLCLYQYMSMGLGPGIEFEVLSQPFVVDLLVSFCYQSSLHGSLKELPVGLGLMVPNPNSMPGRSETEMDDEIAKSMNIAQSQAQQRAQQGQMQLAQAQQLRTMVLQAQKGKTPEELQLQATVWAQMLTQAQAAETQGKALLQAGNAQLAEATKENQSIAASSAATCTTNRVPAEWNREARELTILAKEGQKIRPGDWIAFWTAENVVHHCRLTQVFHPSYQYDYVVKTKAGTVESAQNSKPQKLESVTIIPYNRLFDDLGPTMKRRALIMMLDTLPSVTDMANYIKSNPKAKLAKWHNELIPAALAILRWIIASNRSCIVFTGGDSTEEQVYGMSGYLQFRFASGAPDKESRFIKCVNATRARLKQNVPTMFAWHGSPLKNWHSIIREGLNFDIITNGRAFGNGIYHAQDAATSVGYSGRHNVPNTSLGIVGWPSSTLNIQAALSLNEIVNAPSEFTSKHPYLVVQNVDWVQTRYLFVQCGQNALEVQTISVPQSQMAQDSGFTPKGIDGSALIIPTCAISKSRRAAMINEKNEAKTTKRRQSEIENEEARLGELMSDESDAEDIALYTTADAAGQNNKPPNLTSFAPGSLDRTNLAVLAAPDYATPSASQALQREIRAMLKEQAATPLHELGWYLDPEFIENPYQWIVELHSFDKDLPLAADMKARNIESVVLEIRFGPSFNFSPPFIRVVQPTFLPFMQGGGGHVTAGGAICMELLTSNGWNPSATMSAVLFQVRMAVTSTDPRPARLDKSRAISQYGVGEAVEAYRRACLAHGWTVPDDFRSISSMAPAGPSFSTEGGVDRATLTPAATPGPVFTDTVSSTKKQKRG